VSQRTLYVYTLNVDLPDGCHAPGWEPPNWYEIAEKKGWARGGDVLPFRWPRRRNFFSADRAQRVAHMLREFGAAVEIRVGRVQDVGGWGQVQPLSAGGARAAQEDK
jgi:hypothetical protein